MTDDLLGILDLELLEINRYRGRSVDPGWRRVFGGQVIGQALVAASRTVDSTRLVHSLHGYFCVPAIPTLRSTMRWSASATAEVSALDASCGIKPAKRSSRWRLFPYRGDRLTHQAPMPAVPAPETLPDESALLAALADRAPASALAFWRKPRAIEIRPVDLEAFLAAAGPSRARRAGSAPGWHCPMIRRSCGPCSPMPPS